MRFLGWPKTRRNGFYVVEKKWGGAIIGFGPKWKLHREKKGKESTGSGVSNKA